MTEANEVLHQAGRRIPCPGQVSPTMEMESSDEKATGIHAGSICLPALTQGSPCSPVVTRLPMWPIFGKRMPWSG